MTMDPQVTPVVDPFFPPNTPADIIQAYLLNRGCVCAQGDAICSNCLTVSPTYLMESRDVPALRAIIAIPIIATIVVILRTYSRLFIVKQIGKDDVLAVLGLALYVPFQVLSIVLIQLGSGRHLQYIQFVVAQNPSVLNETEVLDFAAHIIYTTALFVCRLSGIAFYLRLLDRSKSWTVVLCKVSALLISLGFVPQIVLLIIHCNPVTGLWPYGWQQEANDYICLAWGTVYSTNSGISLMCDILLFGTAVTLILGWNLKRRDKLFLTPVLLPGGLVIGISITRLYLVVQGQWEADQSWWYNPMLVIENAEIGGTIIALCAPGLKPLVVKWHSRYRSYYLYPESRGRTAVCRRSARWRDDGSCRSLRELRKLSHQDTDTAQNNYGNSLLQEPIALSIEDGKNQANSIHVEEQRCSL